MCDTAAGCISLPFSQHVARRIETLGQRINKVAGPCIPSSTATAIRLSLLLLLLLLLAIAVGYCWLFLRRRVMCCP
jgi:hypothetical protein